MVLQGVYSAAGMPGSEQDFGVQSQVGTHPHTCWHAGRCMSKPVPGEIGLPTLWVRCTQCGELKHVAHAIYTVKQFLNSIVLLDEVGSSTDWEDFWQVPQ